MRKKVTNPEGIIWRHKKAVTEKHLCGTTEMLYKMCEVLIQTGPI